MSQQYRYRLTHTQKTSIAQNLIRAISSREPLSKESATFIVEWILTGPEDKVKAFYDVWDIVLKNYLPDTRPVLFRACSRRCDGKIASFTGKLETARRFSEGKGLLIICDTKDTLSTSNLDTPGAYRHTFFPITQLVELDYKSEKPRIRQSIYERYKGEDEYIMRINRGTMHTFKWCHE